MLNIPTSQRVALLIDADNAQLNRLEQVLKISDYYGTVTICRAYGDWKKPPLAAWKKPENLANVELIQVDRVGKDTTDKRLLIDGGIILGAKQAETFVVVSGDSDFKQLFESIKEENGIVIGIGNKGQTSDSLPESCDTFYFIENLEEELLKLEKAPLWEFEELLYMAFHELPLKEGWVGFGPLGTKLRELEPEFEIKFGSKKLSEWLRNLGEYFEIRDQMVRKVDRETTKRIVLIYEAYLQARRSDGLAHRAIIGQMLRKLDTNYENRFQGKKLSEWLEAYSHIFKTHQDYISLL